MLFHLLFSGGGVQVRLLVLMQVSISMIKDKTSGKRRTRDPQTVQSVEIGTVGTDCACYPNMLRVLNLVRLRPFLSPAPSCATRCGKFQ